MEDEDLSERLLALEYTLEQKESQIAQLLAQLDEKKKWMNELQATLLQSKQKKAHKFNQERIDRNRFYNENKNQEKIVALVRQQLDSLGYKDMPTPWQMIKYHTDKMFTSCNVTADTKMSNT